MQEDHSKNEKSAKRMQRPPVVIAIAVAIFGVLAMLIVDHGPWTRPQIQTAEVASHMTTGEAASAVGATVTPTERSSPPGRVPSRPNRQTRLRVRFDASSDVAERSMKMRGFNSPLTGPDLTG